MTMQNTNRAEPQSVAGDDLNRLMQRMAEGDQTALQALYDQTSSRVYGLALAILRNPSDAEEVMVDCYQRLWRTAHRFNGAKGSVVGYLLITCRNLSIDRKRGRSLRPAPLELDRLDNLYAISHDLPADRRLELGELQARVRQALENLSRPQIEVIDLAFFSGLTHHEISKQLGEPLGTVKGRIRAALAKLREALGGFDN
jgi:RNA polymerase sigma-70 factor (ECF subfamily)